MPNKVGGLRLGQVYRKHAVVHRDLRGTLPSDMHCSMYCSSYLIATTDLMQAEKNARTVRSNRGHGTRRAPSPRALLDSPDTHRVLHVPYHGRERGEGIHGHLGLGAGDAAQQSRLAGVRVPHQSDVGDRP